MTEDVFTIENGTALRGYPRRAESPAAFKWPDEDVQWAESTLFKEHAHFLLANRERIFADSRMFFAPVNVMSGAAYIGALPKPCVGTYLEWWLRRGKDELAFHVSGSPLSGTNVSKSIDKDGKLVPLPASPSGAPFLSLMKEFIDAHKRYLAERERFDAYSLWEVIQRLKGESPRYDDGFKVMVLEREKARNEGIIAKLVNQISELKSRLQSYKDRLRNALMKKPGVDVYVAGSNSEMLSKDVATNFRT